MYRSQIPSGRSRNITQNQFYPSQYQKYKQQEQEALQRQKQAQQQKQKRKAQQNSYYDPFGMSKSGIFGSPNSFWNRGMGGFW